MPTNSTKELNHYYIVLQQYKDPLSCPHCSNSVLAKHFENHAFEQHRINGKYRCVWCEKVSWLKGEKYKQKKHLLSCFREFVKLRHHSTIAEQSNDSLIAERSNDPLIAESNDPPATNSLSRPYFLLDMTHAFPEKDFFGHAITHPDPLFDITIEEFLNTPASPLPIENLPPLPIPFQDENLNSAASCVLLYLSGTHDFFHVMVRLVAFESFLGAMNEDRDNSHTLPFSCWCDGGTYPEPEYRQHRHAIVASTPKDRFREGVWSNIKLPSDKRPPRPNFPCKKLKSITSPLYLVNTIGYLSKRESRCNFSFKERSAMRDNHFYLYRTLPVDFKLHLALLWPGGVLELLKQTQFQNTCIAELATGVLTHDGRRWTQKIKDFYGHERGLVVRVARDYVPTTRETILTPHFLHLAKGQKLYFEKLPEKLGPDLWLRKQIEGGNCFYDAIEESTWIPRPRDQRILNFHRPVVDRCRELESRLEESNLRCRELESRVREQDAKIKTITDPLKELTRENKSLQSKLEETHLKIQQLTDQVIRYKNEEIARLKRENTRQKQEIDLLKQEIDRQKAGN